MKVELEFELGQRVTVREALHRHYRGGLKVWESERGWAYPYDRTGIVTGVRSLANGKIIHGYEEGNVFISQERFRAYIVTFDIYRKPWLALPQHIEAVD
jgi:hypothetical protein